MFPILTRGYGEANDLRVDSFQKPGISFGHGRPQWPAWIEGD